MNLPAGHALGGFQIVEQIGRGAMGTVYRARQNALERDVALKVLDADDDSEALKRFRDEAIRVARLKHPNILPVFDFGRQDGVTYIAMQLADGGTLAAQVGKPMAPGHAIRILQPAAQALDYAHSVNVIHRDVKPANLLFDADGRLFLSDFGLALMRDSKSSTYGRTVGTPWYMAPEQFRSRAVPASDVYALAITLYQMLTGRVPYDRENPLAVALAHLKDPIPSAREMNPAVSEQIDRILKRGMAKNPSDRYPRAIELLSAIAESLRQGAGSAGVAAAAGVAAKVGATGAVRAGQGASAAGAVARSATAPLAPAGEGRMGSGQAPAMGQVMFESKPTAEWARANLILRDSKAGRLRVADGMTELTMAPPNHAQLMLLQVGLREEVWAELRFGVAVTSGIFDLLWHEGMTAESYCARVDTQLGRLAIGLVPAAGGAGGERWLAARNVPLGPGTEHTVLVVARKGGATQAYLDGKPAIALSDSTLTRGMVRLRMLPAPQHATSTLLLRRIALFRAPV